MRLLISVVLACGCMVDLGCSAAVNPSFDLSHRQALLALEDLERSGKVATRPLVLVSGYGDIFGLKMCQARDWLSAVYQPDQLLIVAHPLFSSFDVERDQLIARIDEAFGPGSDSVQTVEVDIIGFSMGGLISRYAALPVDARRRVNVKRLFTISTPHRGAAWANRWFPDALVRDMHRESAFMASLNTPTYSVDYELTCYVRTGDLIVGAANASPGGAELWWLPNAPFTNSHSDAAKDPRIIADIARRLMHETPLTRQPSAPLP